MDTLSWLMLGWVRAALVVVLVVLAPGEAAYAAGTVSIGPVQFHHAAFGTASAGNFGTLDGACQDVLAGGLGAWAGSAPPANSATVSCSGDATNGGTAAITRGNGSTYNVGVSIVAASCPANSTAGGGSCTCDATYSPNAAGTACEIPSPCAGTLAKPLAGEVSAAVSGQVVPSTVCSGGCGYIPAGAAAAGAGFWTTLAGQYTYRSLGSNWVGNGGSCTGAPVGSPAPAGTPPTPDPSPPPPGMCRGTVNGAVVTVACDGTSSKSGTGGAGSGNTGPDQSASSPAGAVPGTTGTRTGTSCARGTCTTTTTTTTNKPDGTTTTGTAASTTGQDTFCKGNPGDANCAALKSSFSGSCAAATCSGDAIQCQIAKEQALRNCATLDPAPSTNAAVMAGLAGIQPSDHPYTLRTTVALPGAGGFDQTDILSGGCPADLSVAVTAGRSVVIPFSKLCDSAVMLGRVLVGITALSCIGIVFVRRS